MFRLVTPRSMLARGLFSTLAVLIFCAAAGAQDELLKLRAEYVEESNPVDKAKILAKLGSHELDAVRALLREEEEEKALAALEEYCDAVRETTQLLAAAGINAARRPAGFKELQISLRQSIRRMDDFILSVQQDMRPWFRAVRSDLEASESTLIDALFPPPRPRRPRSTSSQ